GISARHGPHHVAQKLTMVTFPRQSAEEIDRPSRSVAVNAGTAAGSRKKRSVIFSPGSGCDNTVSTRGAEYFRTPFHPPTEAMSTARKNAASRIRFRRVAMFR